MLPYAASITLISLAISGVSASLPGKCFRTLPGELSKHVFEAANRAVRSRCEAERVRQHAAEPDNLGRVLLVGQWFVMAGSDLDEFLRKLPGYYQQASGAAVIDSEGLALTLEYITGRAGLPPGR